jgi:hypothetical protein
MYACRDCEQPINSATEVCPYCGADLTDSGRELDFEQLRKPPLPRIVILWGVVLVSIVAIAWFAFPWRLAGSKPDAERDAVAALTKIQEALGAYHASEGAFPSSLEALGAAAEDASREAESGRYTLQYAPGGPTPDSPITTYTLTARAGNYGYVNLFLDETGVFRGTRENRPATAQDPAIESNPSKSP